MHSVKACVICAIAVIFLVYHPTEGTFVGANDPRIQYVGRIDFSNPAGPLLTWPGSSIEGNFTGSRLSLKLNDQNGRNYFNVFIDGDLAHPFVLHATQGERIYSVASALPSRPHRFLLTKRTDGSEGATVFQGLVLAEGADMLASPPRKQRRIEFFGDSITTGVGNEAPANGRDDMPGEMNNFMSYASITARNLDAEAHVTALNGIGLMVSWFPFTMPDYYDQLSAVGDNGSKWDFASWTPDVVVINLMQNDKWLIDLEKRIQPMPSDMERISAYKQFVLLIRSLYPKAYIVCVLGSMDATEPGSKWPGYVRSAVEQIRLEQNDRRVGTVFFDFTGFKGHPRVDQHRKNADRLTTFIRKNLDWESSPR